MFVIRVPKNCQYWTNEQQAASVTQTIPLFRKQHKKESKQALLTILLVMTECPFCGEGRSNNAEGRYNCSACRTRYWQNVGEAPRLIGCPQCKEGAEEINEDGLYECRECFTKWRQEIGEDTPSYGTVDCTGPGCPIEMEFMPGSDTYDCDNCGTCTDATSPDRI